MTKIEAIDRIARAIAEKEGFYVTEDEARRRKIRWPTRAQRNANPGNVRLWRDRRDRWYPTDAGIGPDGRPSGYIDFVTWASERFPGVSREEMSRLALEEGWRVLRVLVGQYIEGRYTGGKPPSLREMFRVYAPASDSNQPDKYAAFVAQRTGLDIDRPIIDQLEA